jgi:hypothetical protein
VRPSSQSDIARLREQARGLSRVTVLSEAELVNMLLVADFEFDDASFLVAHEQMSSVGRQGAMSALYWLEAARAGAEHEDRVGVCTRPGARR